MRPRTFPFSALKSLVVLGLVVAPTGVMIGSCASKAVIDVEMVDALHLRGCPLNKASCLTQCEARDCAKECQQKAKQDPNVDFTSCNEACVAAHEQAVTLFEAYTNCINSECGAECLPDAPLASGAVGSCTLGTGVAECDSCINASCSSTCASCDADAECDTMWTCAEREAYFVELAVFDEACPSKTKLAGGDTSGNTWNQTQEFDGGFTEVGDLAKKKYGFSAVMRDGNCGVVGFGCTPVDLEHHRHITVAVNTPVEPPRGGCASGETCQKGKCVKGGVSEGGTDAEVEADAPGDSGPPNCKLEVIAAESFDLPASTGFLYTGPAVAPTPSGFVVMYREVDSGGTLPRGVRMKIADNGTPGDRVNVALTPCTQLIDADGVSATWNNKLGAGLMAVSLPACPPAGKPQMHISNFDQDGKTIAEIAYELPSPISIAPTKGLAPYPNANLFVLAAMAGTIPFLYVFDGVAVQQDPPPQQIENGGGTSTYAQVASASAAVATLADSDLAGGQLTLRHESVGSGTVVTSTLPSEGFSSLALWSDRAAVVIPSTNFLSWTVSDTGGNTVTTGNLTGGPYTGVDAVTLHDYLFVVGAQAGKITVFRIDDATGTMGTSSAFQLSLSDTVGNTTLKDFQGERLAVAAARNRLVIAWLTSNAALSSATTIPGGYVVLACDG